MYDTILSEVLSMEKSDSELFNTIYREISEQLGIEAAMKIYQMYKGTQVSFPTRLFNPDYVKSRVIIEYNSKNIKQLALKYGYSEKTIRKMLKEGI